MAQLFRDVIAQTRMYLDEVSQKSWLETEVKRNCNYSYQKFVTSVITTYEDFYMTTSIFSLVDGQQEYDVATDGLPNDVFKLRRLQLNYNIADNPTAFRKCIPINISQVKDRLESSTRGSASFPYYYNYGFGSNFKLGVIPVPDKDATNGGKLWYIYEVPNLVQQTDEVNIPYPDRYADGIALIAAGTLLRKGQQEEGPARTYIAEGEALRAQMQQELEDRVSDESKVVMDSIGLDLDFTEPF